MEEVDFQILQFFNAFSCQIFTDSDSLQNLTSSALTRPPKEMQQKLESTAMKSSRAKWHQATAGSVPDFPTLSMNELKELTFGTYQLKIAESYNAEHIRE